ncbi:MAG: hypothetical protein JWQ48_4030 [Conexibacter sp.]|nr:hypothetical protein [Conexibacter sp.]
MRPMRSFGLWCVRYGIPLAMAIAGIVAFLHGGIWQGFGVVVIGFGITVLGLNVLFRVSVRSNKERDVEEQARDYYEVHGHWPDEQ